MRLWHYAVIEFLPDLQLKGQWSECALIADALAKNGTPNHLLVNRVTEYSPDHFYTYCVMVRNEMIKRGFRTSAQSERRVFNIASKTIDNIFPDWHNKEYLRVCMANLYEKHYFGVGKNRITDDEWNQLRKGYKKIIGKEYKI